MESLKAKSKGGHPEGAGGDHDCLFSVELAAVRETTSLPLATGGAASLLCTVIKLSSPPAYSDKGS